MIYRKAAWKRGGQGRRMTILVVILAGGEGRRMGGNKPLRTLAGETLIARAAALARQWSNDVRLALRTGEEVGNVGMEVLLDEPGMEGPLAGLASGLREARAGGHSHLLTLPCDMPFLPADLAKRLAAASRKEVVLAASEGQLHPVCGLWPADALDHVAPYHKAGRRSLKGLAEIVGFRTAEWPADVFVNVNSPEELAAAERRLLSKIERVDVRPGS